MHPNDLDRIQTTFSRLSEHLGSLWYMQLQEPVGQATAFNFLQQLTNQQVTKMVRNPSLFYVK